MKRKIFWAGLAVISLLCSFAFSFLTATLVFLVAGAAWWWVVYYSGFFP
ncbi:MAG: hypothetical protein ACE5IP_10395 [Terriglobia bacterium]